MEELAHKELGREVELWAGKVRISRLFIFTGLLDRKVWLKLVCAG
jgi:hypothetical protein